jgi:hypothetical protein
MITGGMVTTLAGTGGYTPSMVNGLSSTAVFNRPQVQAAFPGCALGAVLLLRETEGMREILCI